MASKSRVLSLKDKEQMQALVKAHIHEDPALNPLYWKNKDIEKVISHYKTFLLAVAHTGHRLDQVTFLASLKMHFEGDQATLKKFAKVMSECLSHCRGKMRGITSGAKTHADVLLIAKAAHAAAKDDSSTLAVDEGCIDEVDDLECCIKDDEQQVAASHALSLAKAAFGSKTSNDCEPEKTRLLKRASSVVSVASSDHAASSSSDKKTIATASIEHTEVPYSELDVQYLYMSERVKLARK